MNRKHVVIDARIRRSSTGRYADRLVEHLQKVDNDYSYTILVQPGDDWQMSNPRFTTMTCRFRQFSFSLIDQLAFARQIYRLKPDLVHFTMTQQPLFYFGKIVTTTHDLTMLNFTRPSRFPKLLHNIGIKLYGFLFWWAHKKSRKIIVPTDFVAKDLANYHPSTKNKIIRTYEASEEPLKIVSSKPKYANKPFIFHLGAPLPHKNIDRLIKAFGKLKASYPELWLILPGNINGAFKESLGNWVTDSSFAKSIIVPGFIEDSQLKWLYENAECYVLPSLSEGFGLPGLEAMAHGCPVVSSNATCLPEVYGDGAHYFDPNSVDDMSTKINEVLSSKELRSQLINNGKKQLKKYSWEKMAKETLAIYKKVLGAD